MDGKKIGGILGGVIAFIICFYLASNGTRSLFGGGVETKIQKMAADVNKGLPMQIDRVTRLDRVEAGPGKSYAYIYTLSVSSLSATEKNQLQANVTSKALDAPEMKSIFDAGVVVWYKYFDAKGAKLAEFSIQR
jgi:hypothetical protein